MCHRQGVGADLQIDSAGTAAWHVGKRPDARAVAAAARHGIDLSPLRARQVTPQDFSGFDYILAMDEDNLADLRAMRPANALARVELFLSHALGQSLCDVPDPYYGGDDGFEHVIELTREASAGFLTHLIARGKLRHTGDSACRSGDAGPDSVV